MQTLRAVKGMNDVLPEEIRTWRRVEASFWRWAERYGFGEVRTPVVEPTSLFVRSIGEATDIVEKEMYTFVDKGEQSLTLRPEGTASAARAYLEHGVAAREPVTKWAYLGPMFRRERPARGRYRQFWQCGAEIYGDPGPHVDAEIIHMVVSMLDELGIADLEVVVNSLGSGDTRTRYLEALRTYLTPHRATLSADSQRRLETNPLRVLDSKAEQDRQLVEGAPNILEFLGEDDRAHLDEVIATLTELGVKHRVDPRLVRGLDYYNRTLFEVVGHGGELGAQNAVCGGGRYDGLVEALGGKSTPAIGYAMGIERLLLAMEAPPAVEGPAVFVVVASPELRRMATVLLGELRHAGLSADADLRGLSMKSQLRRADKSNARLALVLGPSEMERGVVQWKDLRDAQTSEVPRIDVVKRAVEVVRRAT